MKGKGVMNKKVVILSTSLRNNSNSELLAKSFVEGAKESGNEVEYITLKNKDIRFCIGCLACQKTGHCVIKMLMLLYGLHLFIIMK